MKDLMKHTVAVSMVSLLVVAGCQITITPTTARAEKEFTFSTPFVDVGSFSIEWRNGSISVRIDENATDITATGTKTVTAVGQAAADAAIDAFNIVFEVAESFPTQVTLRFDAPSFDLTTFYSANVEVVIPAGINLFIANANGDVAVTGNVASTSIEIANGEVAVTDQQGDTSVEVNNGRVQVVSDSGSVNVRMNNGGIFVAASPGTDEGVIARTDVGSIEIQVPADTATLLSLRGTIGGINVSLGDFTVADLATTLTTLTATLGDGSGEIIGETDIGNITFGSR